MKNMKPVSEKYLGQKFGIGNGQDPDSPNDPSQRTDEKMHGRGSVSGGSKPTPQAHRSGSAKATSSAPRNTQKLRG